MRAVVFLLTAVLLSAGIFGCATGKPYDDRRVALITKGSTTEAQLMEWFGPASGRSLAPDGTKTLNWRFLRKNNPAKSGRLDVRLDAQGTVISFTASSNQQ